MQYTAFENPPFVDDFPIKKTLFVGDVQLPRLIAGKYLISLTRGKGSKIPVQKLVSRTSPTIRSSDTESHVPRMEMNIDSVFEIIIKIIIIPYVPNLSGNEQ